MEKRRRLFPSAALVAAWIAAAPAFSAPPKLLSAADVQRIAQDPGWPAQKAACDAGLGDFVDNVYAGWEWRDAAEQYAVCYDVSKSLNPSDPQIPKYSKKAVALMKVLARHHPVFWGSWSGLEFVGLGDGATKTFPLRVPPLPGASVAVSLTSAREESFTYPGNPAGVTASSAYGGYAPVLKVSDAAGGPAAYAKDIDYHFSYAEFPSRASDVLEWLPGGRHPVSGAAYHVTVADGSFSRVPAGGVSVGGTALTLSAAPAAGQAVFVKFVGQDYEQTGDFQGGGESPKADGPGYTMRTAATGLAYAYDLMRESPDLTPALRAEFWPILNADIDWYAQYGYENNGDVGNYFVEGYLSSVMYAAYGTDDDNPRAQAGGDLKPLAASLFERTFDAVDKKLPGGYGPQGQYSNQTDDDVLHILSIWKNVTGQDRAAQLEWTSNLVPATIHGTKPDRAHFYDGGDWTALPAVPLLQAMKAFVTYQGAHPMAPYARRLLADAGAPIPGAQADYAASFPRSYLAKVSGPLYARSDWGTNAVWLSLAAGPVDFDHQHRDQGHFTLSRGADDLVIDAGEYGTFVTLPYHNTLGFDDRAAGGIITYAPSQGIWGPGVKLLSSLDGGGYVYAQADLTPAWNNPSGQSPVTRAVRTLVYLRPDVVLIHDQAQTSRPDVVKSFTANFPSSLNPVSGGDTYAAAAGASKVFMRRLSPSQPQSVAIAPGPATDGHPSPYNYQVFLSTGSKADAFMHLFQAADGGRAQMAASTYVRSVDGRAEGAEVDMGAQRWVVLSATATAQVSGALAYGVPMACPCGHVVGDLPPQTAYGITVLNAGGGTVAVLSGATGVEGVLSFSTPDGATAQVRLLPGGGAADVTPPARPKGLRFR